MSKAGEIFVTNGGALQDVSVFSAQGQYLRNIGKIGGRAPVGKYDAAGMFNPGSLALDSRGRLWVVETNMVPKRIGVWDCKPARRSRIISATPIIAPNLDGPAAPR